MQIDDLYNLFNAYSPVRDPTCFEKWKPGRPSMAAIDKRKLYYEGEKKRMKEFPHETPFLSSILSINSKQVTRTSNGKALFQYKSRYTE